MIGRGILVVVVKAVSKKMSVWSIHLPLLVPLSSLTFRICLPNKSVQVPFLHDGIQ